MLQSVHRFQTSVPIHPTRMDERETTGIPQFFVPRSPLTQASRFPLPRSKSVTTCHNVKITKRTHFAVLL